MRKRLSIIVGLVLAITVLGLCPIFLQIKNVAVNRTQCINNMKNLGLALHAYHDVKKRLPAAVPIVPTAERPPEQQLSWLNSIIPLLEAHMDPKWIVDETKPWNDVKNQYVTRKHIPVYLCPANERQKDDNYSFSHYVGITGIGKDAAWLPREDQNAGVFGYERVTRLADLKNGASNTMMTAETATDNGPWAQGGNGTARGLIPVGSPYLGEHGQFNSFHGGTWVDYTTNVGLVDGTVRVLANSTADDILKRLATLARRNDVERG